MTREEEIKNAANEYIENVDFTDYVKSDAYDAFIAGVNWGKDHNPEIAYLEHEIERLKSKLQASDDLNTLLTAELEKAKSPWITDRMPEIKGSTSDAVLLLVDRQFYKVSHLERRKDGTEFWWGIHPEDGDEVDAWMPIPKL